MTRSPLYAPRSSRIAIIRAGFYPAVTTGLERGASLVLKKADLPFDIIPVPGAFEIGAGLAWAADALDRAVPRYDGFIALGCVIRGQTDHYVYVCQAVTTSVSTFARSHPSGFGILTVENEADALERANPLGKNIGGKAAKACLAMRALHIQLSQPFGHQHDR